MTATNELCRLLDESGAEYTVDHGYRDVFWNFGESCKARASAIGTRGLVQMIVTGITPQQAIAATLRPCEVWLLMATDVDDGREKVLGVYATKDAAEAAVDENRCGYALHDVQRWEVDA